MAYQFYFLIHSWHILQLLLIPIYEALYINANFSILSFYLI